MKHQLPLCVQTAFLNTISGDLRSPKDNALTLTYSEHGYRFGITAHLDGRIEIAYATYCDSPMKVETISDLFDAENAQTISQKFTEWAKFWNERLNPTKEEPTTQTTNQNTHPYLEKEYTSPEEVKNPNSFPKSLSEACGFCDIDQMQSDLSDLISNIFEKYLEDGDEEWAVALSNVGADYDCYCQRATRGDARACFRSFEYLLEDLEWDYEENEEEVSAFINLCTED